MNRPLTINAKTLAHPNPRPLAREVRHTIAALEGRDYADLLIADFNDALAAAADDAVRVELCSAWLGRLRQIKRESGRL